MGIRGAEEDSDKLQLTDKLLQAVLDEAQVVCIGQPLLIAGDFFADPAVILCLAMGISAGRFVDLVLAYSIAEERRPDATCEFRWEDCVGSRRDFILGCSSALAASTACTVTDRWFTPHLSVLASFSISRWTAEVSCPSRSGLLAGLTLPIGPPLRYLELSRMPGMFTGRNLELYLLMLHLLLGMRFCRSCVDDF